MNEKKSIPKWFWIVTIIALIWNLTGIMQFMLQVSMTSEDLAILPEDQQAFYAEMPSWVNIAFALAVFGGTLGCITLLMRKSWAILLLFISLIGIMAQLYYSFFISHSYQVFGPGAVIMPVMIIIIALLLIWFAKSAKSKGWIS